MTIGIVSASHPHNDQQLVGSSDIIGTVTEEDNNDEEDIVCTGVSTPPPLSKTPSPSFLPRPPLNQ